MTHELKTWPRFFRDVQAGRKTFEVRKDDPTFHEGDRLLLREWELNGGYTGCALVVRVTYVISLRPLCDAVGMAIEFVSGPQETAP